MFSRAIAFAPVFFVAIAALAATTTVTPSNLGTWTMQNAHCSGGTNTGTTAIVAGPATPPLGSGSAQITIGTDGDSFDGFRTPDFNGTLLSALTTLSYSTYTQVDGSGGQSPYLLLNLDFDNDGVLDDQIFFEPVYQSATYFPSNPQGPLTTATWQTWDALNGGWWSVNSTAGADPGTNVKSLAAIIAAQPNARILAPGPGTGSFRVMGGCGGSAWTSYVGNFDGVNVGVTGTVTTYDFEPAPSITINDPSIAEGTGGTTNLVFTLTLSQAVSQTVTVNYTTADDTATVADGDYTLTAGTATFTPFSTTATISVPIGTDNEFEPSETFFVNLTGAANATIADSRRLRLLMCPGPSRSRPFH
jgi:hypothetical protein